MPCIKKAQNKKTAVYVNFKTKITMFTMQYESDHPNKICRTVQKTLLTTEHTEVFKTICAAGNFSSYFHFKSDRIDNTKSWVNSSSVLHHISGSRPICSDLNSYERLDWYTLYRPRSMLLKLWYAIWHWSTSDWLPGHRMKTGITILIIVIK